MHAAISEAVHDLDKRDHFMLLDLHVWHFGQPFENEPCSLVSPFQLSSAVGHITCATASVICFHCDSSAMSWLRPFSVNR